MGSRGLLRARGGSPLPLQGVLKGGGAAPFFLLLYIINYGQVLIGQLAWSIEHQVTKIGECAYDRYL